MKKMLSFGLVSLSILALVACSSASSTSDSTSTTESDTTTVETTTSSDNVPTEYKNALKSAENYIELMAFSKARLYDQLTSETGNKYPAEAAQYAIDNINVDYKEQALKAAKNYLELMPMSNEALKDQLMSEYGDKYTEEEASYAIANLE